MNVDERPRPSLSGCDKGSEAAGDVAGNDENEEDYKKKTDSSAWSVAPVTAVAPVRQASHEQNDQNDE